MKIASRPEDDASTTTIGGGKNRLMLTDDQLDLFAALVAHCRLGQGGFSNVAYELLVLFENQFGHDFINEACENVLVHATIEDDATGMIVCSTKNNPNCSVTLELQ